MQKSRWPAFAAFCEKHKLGFTPVDLPPGAIRFRLRTLLIVVTVLAVILAYVGNVLIHIRQQSAIVKQIEEAKGSSYFYNPYVGMSGSSMERDEWNRKNFGEHTFRYVRHVHFYAGQPRDEVLALLPKLSRLEALQLSANELTPENLRHIANCRRLQTLVLQQKGMQSAGLVELRELARLRQVSVIDFDEARMCEVAALSTLEDITLRSRHTSPSVLAELKRLPLLKTLEIDGCADDARSEICSALVGLDRLETLSLRNFPPDAADLQQLAKLPALRTLQLSEMRALKVESAAALRQVTQLRRLNLGKYCTDESLAALAGLPELEWLSLHESDVSDASVPALRQFPKLRHLYVTRTKLTADGVIQVAEGSQLRDLGVSIGLLSHEQQQELMRRRPHPVIVREH